MLRVAKYDEEDVVNSYADPDLDPDLNNWPEEAEDRLSTAAIPEPSAKSFKTPVKGDFVMAQFLTKENKSNRVFIGEVLDIIDRDKEKEGKCPKLKVKFLRKKTSVNETYFVYPASKMWRMFLLTRLFRRTEVAPFAEAEWCFLLQTWEEWSKGCCKTNLDFWWFKYGSHK